MRNDKKVDKGDERHRPTYDAEKVRQGRIVLDTPVRKAIFFGGLVIFVVAAAVLPFLG